MRRGEWAQPDGPEPPEIDFTRPSSARVYDYLLGGAYNFAVDRQVAEGLLAVFPEAPLAAQANRAFLRRAVRFLVDAGVRQFLDLGSGIPTMGHVHEIAQASAPDVRVVYVDIDPVAVSHSREIVSGNPRTAVVQEDVRHPERIVDAPEVRRLIDFTQPVAVLVMALLHYLPDGDDPGGILARVMAPLASGSYLALSHATNDAHPDTTGVQVYRRAGIDMTPRTHAEVRALFRGLELVEPGLVWVKQWRPEWTPDGRERPESSPIYGGVARKL